MGSEVYFAEGDLLEYEREFPGQQALPDEPTVVRAQVVGFEVKRDDGYADEEDSLAVGGERFEISVHLVEGRADGRSQGVPKRTVCHSLSYILSLNPEVVQTAPSWRSLDDFDPETPDPTDRYLG